MGGHQRRGNGRSGEEGGKESEENIQVRGRGGGRRGEEGEARRMKIINEKEERRGEGGVQQRARGSWREVDVEANRARVRVRQAKILLKE